MASFSSNLNHLHLFACITNMELHRALPDGCFFFCLLIQIGPLSPKLPNDIMPHLMMRKMWEGNNLFPKPIICCDVSDESTEKQILVFVELSKEHTLCLPSTFIL